VPPEQILFFAVFLLISLVNVIVRFLRTRARQAREAEERAAAAREAARARHVELPGPRPPAWPPPLPVEVRRADGVPGPRDEVVTAAAPARASTPRPPRRRARSVRLGSPADLRRTIVLMAVLGPCRALEGQRPPPGG
jgi:hypothetical protein